MQKLFLLVAATALLLFYAYGFVQWLQSGHNVSHVWQAATSDWFLAVTVLDLSLFGLLCLIWLYRDLQQRNISAVGKFLLLLVTLLCGVVVVLYYLALRKNRSTPTRISSD